MKVVSNKKLTIELGDSKLIIHNLSQSDKYILTIQSKESASIVIVGKEAKGYETCKDGKGEIGQCTIIDGVAKEEIFKLITLLQKTFPQEEKNNENS